MEIELNGRLIKCIYCNKAKLHVTKLNTFMYSFYPNGKCFVDIFMNLEILQQFLKSIRNPRTNLVNDDFNFDVILQNES